VGNTVDSQLSNLISLTDAAKRAGVARNTIHRAVRLGKLKAIKLGRDWFIDVTDIDRWKAEHYRPDMALRYPIQYQAAEEIEDEENGR
jgi:excisionase family DNA binding protein